MSLFRFLRRISFTNALWNHPHYAGGRRGGYLEPGDVVEGPFGPVYGARPAGIQELPDPRERTIPKTLAELLTECDYLTEWIQAGHLPWFTTSRLLMDAERVARGRLEQLFNAAVDLSLIVDALPIGRLDERTAKVMLNKLRRSAAEAASPLNARTDDPPAPARPQEPTLPLNPDADTKEDNQEKKLPSIPQSKEVRALIRRLRDEQGKGRTDIDIAREFSEQNEKKANNLLRQARRYPHLWKQS